MPSAAAVVANHPAPGAGVIAAQQARAISDMRAFLARLSPTSAAESLRLLRNAYPDAPLNLRVAAYGLTGR